MPDNYLTLGLDPANQIFGEVRTTSAQDGSRLVSVFSAPFSLRELSTPTSAALWFQWQDNRPLLSFLRTPITRSQSYSQKRQRS